MENKQSISLPVAAVTANYNFCSATSQGEKLFSVRAGIPVSAALDQLSALMSSSIASIEALASEEDTEAIPGALWQSVHLMNFAYALVQSIHAGHNAAITELHALNSMPINGKGV